MAGPMNFHSSLSPNVKWMSQSKGKQHGQDGEKLLAKREQTATRRIPSNYGGKSALRAYHIYLPRAAALPAMRWRTDPPLNASCLEEFCQASPQARA